MTARPRQNTPACRGSAFPVRAVWLLSVVCLSLGCPATARADDEVGDLFASGVRALGEGRPGDAASSLESLADRGVVDPVASYDRGLAYAMRVRIGGEVPGDLGRAAHGFEEARDLSHDQRLVDDAARALAVVRSEVARRRARAGDPVEVDPGRSLARTVAGLVSEDGWSVVAAIASAVLGIGVFVRWLVRSSRVRVAGALAAGIAAPLLAIAIVMTLASRNDRMHLREAIVVASGARPNDERGITLAGAPPLPEGARVEIIESRGNMTRVRFGAVEAWVGSGALRELAHS